MSKPKSLRARLTLTTAMAGALLISYGSRSSYAGSCPPVGGGAYFCAGGAVPGEAGVSIDYGGPVTVTTSSAPPAGFGIDTTGTGDTAISIKADGGLTFDDTNTYGSIITGDDDGLEAINTDGGAVTITTNGPVSGLGGEGITASNSSDGTDLTISAADVYGNQSGIKAINAGSGAIAVSATGTVTGTVKYGIQAENMSASATDLTITAADVSGGQFGVRAINFGTGTLSITASGTVTGGQFQGIAARNLGTDLTISAQGVSGGADGILALHEGSGSLSIAASDTVTATTGTGIRAENSFSGANLTISAAGVSGATSGIVATNSGTGDLSITSTGLVTGTSQNGIYARNNNAGGGNLTISAAGVSGANLGIYAKNFGTGGVNITATGAVTATTGTGIVARNNAGGAITISASDTVASNGADGISALQLGNGGDLTISAAGVSGATHGINASNFGTGGLLITTTGQITGGSQPGIRAVNTIGGGLSIVATEQVTSAAASGIDARSYSNDASPVTISAAAVQGNTYGINAKNGGLGDFSISASGTVTGTTQDGIRAVNSYKGASLTISAAGVSGGGFGVYARNEGSGDLKVMATGPVVGQGGMGISARNVGGGGEVVVTANDTVSGTSYGISARNYGDGSLTVTATDTVIATGGIGISTRAQATSTDTTISAAGVEGASIGVRGASYTTGNLSITTTGAVTGGTGAGIEARSYIGGGTTVMAMGPVTSAGAEGIDARAFNDSTGLSVAAHDVQGQTDGIGVRNYGFGDTSITADGTVTALGGKGINAFGAASTNNLTIGANVINSTNDGIAADHQGTGDLLVTVTGTITSLALPGEEVDGIDVNNGANGANLTVTTAAVTGQQDGIDAANFGTGALSIVASGPVIGTDDEGIDASNSDNSTNLTIEAADVSGNDKGIQAINNGMGDLSITTTGTVTGATQDGIRALNDPTAANLTISAAAVSGGTDGIDARNDGTGNLSITTTGPVTGGSGYGIAARNYYGGALTITAEDTVSSASIDGIRARNEAGATDVIVNVAGVSGAVRGIDVRNIGTGNIDITATGMVTGGLRQGIEARNYNGGDMSITAEAKVSSTDWDGISAKNNDGGGALTISAAEVSGGRSGIRAEHLGTGALSITAGGDVTGDTTEGIFALIDNAASGADLTISAMAVTGGTDGIDAENVGSGSVFVTTSGPVTADGDGYGIRVGNSAGGDVSITAADTVTAPGTGIAGRNYGPMAGDVTITAASVTGRNGIVASTQGTGSVSVTATGAVIGTAAAGGGINALNTGGTDISISTVDVMGGARGITARNTGTGSTIIDADGTVTGLSDIALYAYNGVGAGDITISAMDVEGANFGILARSRGDGSISVTTAGDVTGAVSDGIRADAASLNATQVTVAAQSVLGAQRGIDARNNGTGHLDVVAAGTVAGVLNEGIRARITNTASGGDLTISAADVDGGTYGIVAENRGGGGLGITAVGAVVGGTNDGIRATNTADGTDMTISAASVVGGAYGIFANNQGTGDLSVTTEGPVTAGIGDGIFAWNYNGGALSVTATDVVTSIGGEGVYASNFAGGTSLTISAAGVSAGRYGIIGRNEGDGDFTVTATGVVASTIGAGIFAENLTGGALDITAEDDVVSTDSVGINARNLVGTTHLTIEAASIDAGKQAINALNEGTGDLSITANGPATSGAYGGIVATNFNGGALGITAMDSATATGGDGMYAYNGFGGTTLTISAAGVSGSYHGITAVNRGSGDLTVLTDGSVEGGARDGMYIRNGNGGALSVTATEHVSSADLNGIRAVNYAGGSTLTISTAGVSGFTGGIIATNAGTGDIAVKATGEVSGGPLGDGMRVRNLFGGSLSITATELVSSGLSPSATGIFAENRGGGDGLSVSATDVFGNRNGITARHYAVGALNVTTTGSVTGATGVGIQAYNTMTGSSLTVSAASVTGGTDAIQVDHQGTGDLLVTVGGAISGGTGAGINNIDTFAQGGIIEVTETASVEAASGVAVMDGDGGTLLWSKGALVDDVMLNGGEDAVALIDGSATGLISLGIENDTFEIFGAGAGGGWDDADFSGTFDNNLGQVLQIDGGDGLDTVELFGVTAASQALGAPTGLEALALSANTLVQANDADLTPFGAIFVDATSTLQAEGNSPSNTVVGSLGNEGVVDLADGEANDMLRVTGDYAGATGSWVLLDLDTDAGTSDTLVIEGDVTDVAVGPFTVIHDGSLIDVNLIGAGSRTTGDGIRLIEVSGATDGDDFALAGPVEGDIFGYELVFEDGVHFLRSDFFDQIYLYENLPGAMQTIGLALTGQLVERVGVRSAVPSALADADGNPVAGGAPVDTALWGRAVGLSVESEGDLDSITGTSFDQTVGFVQAGVDVTVLERQSGRLLIGALGHWGTSSLDANTFDGDDAGSADFDFYGGGLTATWYSTQGWYFDNVVQYTAYDIDISTASRFSTTSTDGYAITTSHEVGYRIPISETAALVPQAQLTYQHIDFDDFIDPDGVRISLDDGDSLIGRAGLAFENSAAIGSALATGYLEANVLHEFLGDNSVNVATGFGTTPISQETRGTSVELGFGGTVAVSRGVSLYAEVDYTIPFDNGVQGFQALGGIRVNLNPPPPPPLPAPVIAPVAETAFIVFFDWDRADLTSEANLVLDEVAVVANETGYASIRLDGYTDLSGSAAYNLGLSERRANAVANGLIARGIAPDEIVIRAFGEENPLVPTPDGVREPQNRRVEIFLS